MRLCVSRAMAPEHRLEQAEARFELAFATADEQVLGHDKALLARRLPRLMHVKKTLAAADLA
jgi:hypothetical protein